MNTEVSGFSIPLTHLQRRPGNMWETECEFEVPSDMGVALAHIDPATKISAHIRLESVMEGVLVTAELSYHVDAECSRCLDPLDWSDSANVMELFLYPETDSRGRVLGGASDYDGDSGEGETVTHYVVNDSVDLEEVVRDAIVLELPLQPLCDPRCQGLCPTCGEKLSGEPHHHETLDPRWSALEALKEDGPPGSG